MYVSLRYKLEGETETSVVYLANKTKDKRPFTAKLYQFTSNGRTFDLDIVFKDHKDDLEAYAVDKDGKKSLMLLARGVLKCYEGLSFQSSSESRFGEVAVTSYIIEIEKKIKSDILSAETTYAIYLICKLPHYQKSRFHIDSKSLNKISVIVVLDLSKLAILLFSLRDKDIFKSKDPQVVVAATKLPILNPNEFDLWKMRIEIINGAVQIIAPTIIVKRLAKKNKLKARGTLLMAFPNKHQLKFNIHKDAKSLMKALEKSLPSEWKTHTLIWKNKADLEEQSLNDLFNNLKIYEAEVKGSSISSQNTQNIAFVSSNNTDNTNESVSIVPSVCAASYKASVSTLPNEMDLKWQMAMLTMRARRSPRDNKNKNTPRRTVLVEADEEPTNYALMAYASSGSSSSSRSHNEVAPCFKACLKGLASVKARLVVYEQNENVFEEDIKLLKLNVILRDNALVELKKKFKKAEKEKDDLKLTLEKFQTSSKNLSKLLESQVSDKTGLGYDSQVFNSQVIDCEELHSNESDDSVPTSLLKDRHKSGEGYHVVPPPYTGTFMPFKPDLVFNDAPSNSESIAPMVNVESSSNKPSKDMSKTLRSDAPIIEDWIFDSEDETEIESMPKQKEPSFVPTSKHVKTTRESVKKVEHPTQAENLRTTNQKSRGHKNSWNRKACFVFKSLNHLIKVCDYYEKQMVQKPVWNNAIRVNHQNTVRMTHPHLNRNVVPTAVLTRSRLVSLNAARPDSTDVPQSTVQSPKPVKHVFNKEHSPIRRSINHRPTTKISNFHKKVTTVKVNKVNVVQGTKSNAEKASANWVWKPKCNSQQALKDKGVIDSGCSRHMTRNISFLLDFEEFNGGYVAFGGNPKGGKISGKGDLTCLFAKATLDESNLWHRRLGHKNFKTLNKLVKLVLLVRRTSNIEPLFSRMKRIKREFSVAKTPQQNRVAERKNRTLIEATRNMLVDSLLPIPFWVEAVNTACYVQNRNTDDGDAFDVKENENDVHVYANGSGKSDKIFICRSFLNPDDPDMPELEDIVYSDDEEDVGAEVDVSNLETYISISPIPTTRVHKNHLVTQIIGDLTSAPQIKSMTRIVKQQGELHQINDEDFNTYLPKGKRAIGSKWVFKNKKDERGIVIRNKARLVAHGHTQEEVIDYDEVFAPVARIEVILLFLAYASFMCFMVYQMDVKSAFLYENSKKEKPLLKDPDGEDVDVHIYSDYARASLDRKSTTGGCQFLGCRLISWQCKKQTIIATSSEAEYVATASCCAQVLWIQIQLLDYGKELASPKQTAHGKDNSNPFMAGSLPKTKCYKLIMFGLTKDAAINLMMLGFNQIMDFLTTYAIWYALVLNPTIYVSCIKQFWASATIKKCVSAKRTVWNEFSCFMASVVICLATELVKVSQELGLLCLLPCWFNHYHRMKKKKEDEIPNAPTPPSPTKFPFTTFTRTYPYTSCYTSSFTTIGTTNYNY
nr:hypothetical protein [Tanacetum cinerariifolium]